MQKQIDQQLSAKKRKIFTVITILLPLVILPLLELSLRIFNYAGNQRLFISMEGDFAKYKRCNPKVAKRYFNNFKCPIAPKDVFLKKKPENGYRIFVMGGSTAAGFPYSNNLTFSQILESKLAKKYPDKHIEVVNTAMSAVNSYTLLDFVDEILVEEPDLILIYAGHNEFYGALGVASMESIGKSPGFARLYLKLNKFKIFLLLRDVVGNIKRNIVKVLSNRESENTANTLMARIVGDKEIPYHSDLYNLGKKQFEGNLDRIIQKIRNNNVNVIVSELVSNIKDNKPFVSKKTDKYPTAVEVYKKARDLENKSKFRQAKNLYYKAKDLDALRFRASEEFNDIILNKTNKYNVPIVGLKQYFERRSEHNIIGNELLLEHLHPNIDGYFLLADAFYDEIIENKYISDTLDKETVSFKKSEWGYTKLDSVYGRLSVKHLQAGWPFQKEGKRNMFLETFTPENKIQEYAFKAMISLDYSLEISHLNLAEHYEQQGKLQKAFNEYRALYHTIPNETMFYEKAARVLLKDRKYKEALPILLTSLEYKKSYFAVKWSGQIYYKLKEYNKAIKYMERARQIGAEDTQLVFNLARAYLYSGDIKEARKYYRHLKNINPDSKYTHHLRNIIR